MAPATLTTARLLLRRFMPADAPEMHAILSDREAMRFWSTLPHERLEQTESWVASSVAAADAGESDEFVVLLQGSLVGKVGIWRRDEIGMIFAPAVWGRGIAREATEAVLARADARERPTITAECDPLNGRVLRLLVGLGFVETGRAARTICLGDVWADSVYLARTRPNSRGPALSPSHEV